ncbi:MAG: hypothetical protein K9K86_07260 [Pseudomonadales bacterium]|nr:hypothetical protein [Pseudomonadales bacterium]
MSVVITDIWFVTEMDLQELASKLGLTNINFDSGDNWQWISGELLDFKLDITQTYPEGFNKAQTRVFLFDKDLHFSVGFTDFLAIKLKTFGISPIYFGRWLPITDHQYKQCIVKVET